MILHNLVYFGKHVILRNAWLDSLDVINGPSREAALCLVAQDHVTETAWSAFCTDLERSTTDDRVFKSYLRIFYVWAVLRTWRPCRKLVPHSCSPIKRVTVSQRQQIILNCSRPEGPITITTFKSSSNWLPRPSFLSAVCTLLLTEHISLFPLINSRWWEARRPNKNKVSQHATELQPNTFLFVKWRSPSHRALHFSFLLFRNSVITKLH